MVEFSSKFAMKNKLRSWSTFKGSSKLTEEIRRSWDLLVRRLALLRRLSMKRSKYRSMSQRADGKLTKGIICGGFIDERKRNGSGWEPADDVLTENFCFAVVFERSAQDIAERDSIFLRDFGAKNFESHSEIGSPAFGSIEQRKLNLWIRAWYCVGGIRRRRCMLWMFRGV